MTRMEDLDLSPLDEDEAISKEIFLYNPEKDDFDPASGMKYAVAVICGVHDANAVCYFPQKFAEDRGGTKLFFQRDLSTYPEVIWDRNRVRELGFWHAVVIVSSSNSNYIFLSADIDESRVYVFNKGDPIPDVNGIVPRPPRAALN